MVRAPKRPPRNARNPSPVARGKNSRAPFACSGQDGGRYEIQFDCKFKSARLNHMAASTNGKGDGTGKSARPDGGSAAIKARAGRQTCAASRVPRNANATEMQATTARSGCATQGGRSLQIQVRRQWNGARAKGGHCCPEFLGSGREWLVSSGE